MTDHTLTAVHLESGNNLISKIATGTLDVFLAIWLNQQPERSDDCSGPSSGPILARLMLTLSTVLLILGCIQQAVQFTLV